jgi:hypothetical protein
VKRSTKDGQRIVLEDEHGRRYAFSLDAPTMTDACRQAETIAATEYGVRRVKYPQIVGAEREAFELLESLMLAKLMLGVGHQLDAMAELGRACWHASMAGYADVNAPHDGALAMTCIREAMERISRLPGQRTSSHLDYAYECVARELRVRNVIGN